MTDTRRFWVWVFGDIAGLRWVLEHKVMAFPGTQPVRSRMQVMQQGDRAVLYTGRRAFHNPSRDVARLVGLATVLAAPTMGEPVTIQGREFPWTLPIQIDAHLPEQAGPELAPLISRLSIVQKPEWWGAYFRTSPVEVPEADFRVLAETVEGAAEAM